MPCGALARGGRVAPPQFPSPPGYFLPPTNPGHMPPFMDWIDNSPCGRKLVTSVAGVDVSAQALCQFHWQMVNGQAAFKAPIVLEP